jgi:hypothetical protein
VSWDQRFDDPIVLPGRKPLVTLPDAALYMTKLPKAEHTMHRNGKPRWKRCSEQPLEPFDDSTCLAYRVRLSLPRDRGDAR